MKNLVRVLVGLLGLMAMMLLASCSGAPGCPQFGFGSSTACSSGGSGSFGGGGTGGGGGGGGGGSTPSAFAYAVDSTYSTIDGFAFSNSGGSFAAISNYTAPSIPPNDGGVGMVIAQSQYLYAAFASANLIYEYTINSSGQLTPVANQATFSAPYLADYVSGVGQANMIVNPLGTLMFVSDELEQVIHVYEIGSAGVLSEVTGSPFACPAGFEPMNLATDGLGKYLYAVDGNFVTHQGTAIAAFSIGTGTNFGVLTPLASSPFVGTPFNMWQLRGDPTGNYLIGTSGSSVAFSGFDDDNLYVFQIAQSGSTNPGSITLLTTETTGTYSPYTIAAQSNTDGDLVYSFGFTDNSGVLTLNPIVGFTLTGTGGLTADSNSPFTTLTTAEGTWGQFDQSGAFLFTYVSGENSSGVTITQLAPLAVSTSGALVQPAPAVTLNNPGFWAVTDPQ
ncbi:MAG TPA: hypothetical protein VMD99_03200 [Terriglobales bacterium]|nr:hypothetical protein [Terriglobales bacterium]